MLDAGIVLLRAASVHQGGQDELCTGTTLRGAGELGLDVGNSIATAAKADRTGRNGNDV